MATGWPMKTTYANGDVYSASDVNDITGTINLLGASVAYTAGKNRIINGNFAINQRSFSSSTSSFSYGFDRFCWYWVTGTTTATAQTFTAGTAPVTGYEAANFQRMAVTGQTGGTAQAILFQNIEDVRTFAGQTATISFWAKAGSGTPKIGVSLTQSFGSGGSPSSNVITGAGSVTLTTSWVRYSVTVAIPSISGKTVGTTANTSYLQIGLVLSDAANAYSTSVGTQNATFDIWGVQAENGSTATAFQTATGTIQGELAACQRYYWRSSDTSSYANYGIAYAVQTNSLYASIKLPVTMRVRPTSVDYSTLGAHLYNISVAALSSVTLDTSSTSADWGVVLGATTGLTQFRPYGLNNNNSTSGYIGFSAEL